MLDNAKEIEEIDQSNMRKLLLEFPSQCEKAIQLAEEFTIPGELFQKSDKIVICGLGGSAIEGDILKTLLKQSLEIPILVNRSYGVPATVNEKTLTFIISYSGNTEETLTAYEGAMKRKSRLISICSGGKLEELTKKDKVPCLLVPPGMPPRTTTGYLSIPLLKILERLKQIAEQSQDYDELIKVLNNIRDRYGPEVPASKNPAKALSQKVVGKIPLIYGVEDKTDVVAHRLKTQFNENSKIIASWDAFPELNHNEIVAWDKSILKNIEKAILASDLGINPSNDGNVIRLIVPPLTEERRKGLAKLAREWAEEVRVSIRNLRREARAKIEDLERRKDISEDEKKRAEKDIQNLTDDFINQIDQMQETKAKQVSQI